MKHQKIDICPICNNRELTRHLDLKDHYFSKENFTILLCSKCGLGITQPQPSKEEISKYYDSENYISHGSKKRGLINMLYGFAQKRNFSSKLSLIESLSPKKSLLDYGAGSGYFCSEMQSKGFKVTGFEPSSVARENAFKTFGLELSPNLPISKFDIITLWHVLEHVHDLKETFGSLVSLLNQDGYIFVALPNYQSYDAKHYKDLWAAFDVPRHLWHFNEFAIKELATNFGLTHLKTAPMKFDALYVSMLSEQFKKGSKIKGLFNGLRSNYAANKKTPHSSQIYIFKK